MAGWYLQTMNDNAARLMALRLRWLSSWRYFRAHPLQLILGIVGVSVGVAAVVAVSAARQAVGAAFERNLQVLQGVATHTIVARQGEIERSDYAQLRQRFPTLAMAPLLRERARLVDPDSSSTDEAQPVEVLGVDIISEAALSGSGLNAGSWLPSDNDIDIAAWLGGEPLALVADALSTEQTIRLRWNRQTTELMVAGTLSSESAAADDLVMLDISLASRLFVRDGIDVIRLQLDASQAEAVEAWLPGNLELRAAGSDQTGLGSAFSLNLTAMGLLALLMGVLIVFSTFRLLLLQRQSLTCLRHALGSSPKSQAGDALCEALLLGVAGTVTGLAGGLLLAQVVIAWIQQTLSDLWVSGFNSDIMITPQMLLLAVLAGVGGAILAVLPLLWRVYRTGYLETSAAEQRRIWLLVLGALMLLLGVALLFSSRLLLALAGLFAVSMGYLLLSVPLLGRLAHLLRQVFNWQRWLGVVAARRLQFSLAHTAPALVALILAVASIAGIGSMVSSFRASVGDWLDTTLSAPAYINADREYLPADLRQWVGSWPGVTATSWLHTTSIELQNAGAELSIVDLPPQGRSSYTILSGKNLWHEQSQQSPAVMIGETLAARRRLAAGDTISFSIPVLQTEISATISGVFQDYRAGPGRVVIRRDQLQSVTGSVPEQPTGVGIYFDPALTSAARLEQRFNGMPGLSTALTWYSAAEVKSETLRIFDQTFLLTRSLRWIVALVALVGITGALLALQLERGPELRLLQRLGLSGKEQRRLLLYESALLGLLAVLLALPLGAGLGWMLCEVINQRAFGWHIEWRLLPAHFLLAVSVGLLATLLAGGLCLRGSSADNRYNQFERDSIRMAN